MNRTAKTSLVIGGFVAGIALTPLGALAKQGVNYVILQTSAGAPAQGGHISVTGNVQSGSLSIKDSSPAGGTLVSVNDTGAGNAIWAESASNQRVIVGTHTKTTGQNVGVEGTIRSGSGAGVFGNTSGSTGAGNGVQGQASTPLGIGVYGTSTSGYGVRGYSSSYPGVSGLSATSDGASFQGGRLGVYASTSSVNNHGGVFISSSSTGSGVGVLGQGQSYSTGWGVYSVGRFAATGTKAFQIDDPKDPAHGLLNHYCAEGPDPLNVYSGIVTTDRKGYATISLPDYFEDINRDPRYHLTVVDESDTNSFALAKVVRGVQGNQFRIRTSLPTVKVSWRVDGIRNDAFVRAYGAPVRQEKVGVHEGKYLHPELYGKDETLQMHRVEQEPAPAIELNPPTKR